MSLSEELGLAQAPTASATGPEASGTAVVPTLPEFGEGTPPAPMRDLRLLADVEVQLSVELGRVRLPLRDLLSLEVGSVVELDRSAESPVDVLINGTPVARGEVVVIDGEFGVRVTSIVER